LCLSLVEDVVRHGGHLSTFDFDHGDAAVATLLTRAVHHVDIPARRHDVRTAEGEDIPHAEVLHRELELGILLHEVVEPLLDLPLPSLRPADGDIAWKGERGIVSPVREKGRDVAPVERRESGLHGLPGHECSDWP
jgi:hypothetical protein